MKVRTHISNALQKALDKVRYDTEVKKILSNKTILTSVLKYTVSEFKDMPVSFIRECIEGEVTYDILFYVILPSMQRIKLIIDLEAQKSYYPGYGFVTKGIFYCTSVSLQVTVT